MRVRCSEHDARNSQPQRDESPTEYLQRVIDSLCELSLKDPLTGLGNRRHFLSALERQIETVARSGESVLLLMLDIDHFKSINDTHGHLAGDQVLRTIAHCLARCVRPVDTVARYGGEEFAIILPNCRPLFGLALAERIRRAVAELSVAVSPCSPSRPRSASAVPMRPSGCAPPPSYGSSAPTPSCIALKANGRNQACIDQPQELSVSAEEKGLLFSHLATDNANPFESARTMSQTE